MIKHDSKGRLKYRIKGGVRIPSTEFVAGWHLIEVADFVALMQRMWDAPPPQRAPRGRKRRTLPA